MLLRLAQIPDILATTILPHLSPRDQAALSETCTTLHNQTRDYVHRKIKCRSCHNLLLSSRAIPSPSALHFLPALSTHPATHLRSLHSRAIPGLTVLEFPNLRFREWQTDHSFQIVRRSLTVSRLCYLIDDHPVYSMHLVPMDCATCGNLVAYLCASLGITTRLSADMNKFCGKSHDPHAADAENKHVIYASLQFSRAGTVVVDHWDRPCWKS